MAGLRRFLATIRTRIFPGSASNGGPEPRPQPSSSLASSAELQAWISKLELENRSVRRRNRVILAALAIGLLALGGVLWGLYQSGIGTYAVLRDVRVTRNPANQGRLQISFQVVSPGKAFYERTSGRLHTELVDYFRSPGEVRRVWSWVYEPGKDIDVSLMYRGGLFRRAESWSFPTARQADIVVLMDTTGSMGRSIHLLKEKCIGFSNQLKQQSLEHRFALIGFGDTSEDAWLDKHDFTGDPAQFQKSVSALKRFDGGDLPESALDALEVALAPPLRPEGDAPLLPGYRRSLP